MKPQAKHLIGKTKTGNFQQKKQKIVVQKIKKTDKGLVVSFTKVR